MERLYTVIYAFMATELGLKGLAKEVFATIFNFWVDANYSETWVSITTMQKITGGSRPAVVKAIQHLERRGKICTCRNPGKRSTYMVTIPPDLLSEFKNTFMDERVNSVNQQRETKVTSTSSPTYPQKKEKRKMNKSLIINSKNFINTGGLPEI